MSRVAVAMSGGVDSSAAAALLREAGHEVVGITLQLWDHSATNLATGKGRCCSPADIADARQVAAQLGFPHFVFDHSESFRAEVVEPFVAAYASGLTPSPCVRCNRKIKFDLLWRLARSLGAEFLATGHYARVAIDDEGRPEVRRAHDESKDQSYFLFDVPIEQLRGVWFPLGERSKQEVRELASDLRLHVADKPESYELCFIPDGDKDAFIDRQAPDRVRPGLIRHVDGQVLGKHAGLHRYTVGQRRGLGGSHGSRLYVLSLDAATATVTAGPEPLLYADELIARSCNWLVEPKPRRPFRAQVRIRHRHRACEAHIDPRPDGSIRVRFDRPQRAVTPGQGVALYEGDRLLGGGWISREILPQEPTGTSA